MIYTDVIPGVFIRRVNRFIAQVEVGGRTQECHVRNTGRLKELLQGGAKVLLQPSDKPGRKTAYSLISVYKGDRLVNIDSLAPNKLFAEYVRGGGVWPDIRCILPESSWGHSRFDFLINDDKYVEVKGVTLENSGVAMFPDAPTQRGVRHVRELIACMGEGYSAAIAFVIQMGGVHSFRPNDDTHAEFGDALRSAAEKGVQLMAFRCTVQPGELWIDGQVPIEL